MADDKIELTLNQLLTNPTGSHTAFMASRARIIEDLEMRYARLRKKHGLFNYKLYKKSKGYIFVFKIPSETVEELFYDVVIQFEPPNEEAAKDRTINRYLLKLFSNSPNFVFTYVYVLNKSDMVVPFLIDKFNDKALNDPPKVKNPVEVYGFEKSCYYACLFIKELSLTNKFSLDANVYLFNEKKVASGIKSDASKMAEYNMAKQREKDVKKAKRKAKTAAASGKSPAKVKKTKKTKK